MSDTKEPELSGLMNLNFSRDFPEKNAKLVITIENTGHFADAMAYARQHGLEQKFWDTFVYLLTSAIGPTLPQRASAFGEGENRMEFPERPARDGTLEIWPDGPKVPSFMWMKTYAGQRDLVGGMIHHRHSRDWSLHT